MKKTIVLISLLMLLLISGCDRINNVFKPALPIINNTNTTEQTTLTTTALEPEKDNLFFFQSKDNCAFYIDKTNKTTLIDCGANNYLSTIKKINQLGYNKIDRFIITNSKTDNMDKLVLRFKPDFIYETPIPKTNNNYKEYNFSTIISVTNDMGGIKPTYREGLFPEKEMNTLVVSDEKFILMSGCYGECEKRITNENVKIMALANNGHCETNSILFMIQTNPSAIFSNSDICANISSDLEALGMVVYNKDLKDYHIVFDGDTYTIG